MKLLIPYVSRMEAVDARLAGVAEFLGIGWEALALGGPAQENLGIFERRVDSGNYCLVINPAVIGKWSNSHLPAGFAQCLRSRFPNLLLYNAQAGAFDATLISELSGGRLCGAEAIGRDESYSVSSEARDVCKAFAGITFGPANPVNDCVFRPGSDAPEVRNLISIGGKPFLAALRSENCELLLVGSADVLDLGAEADEQLASYFSRFLPFAMALRHSHRKEHWRASKGHACVIVDDPLLRRNYGFLNYDVLLRMMEDRNFHTTVAFIPYNWRRSSPEIANMFRVNSGRLSLCVHGNDHTGAEFATVDKALLRSMLQIAEQRIRRHSLSTGVNCERVMVFPQGKFSGEAMSVLQAMNFDCAVNTGPYTRQSASRLTIREVAQPALLRYSDFPLFLRRRSAAITHQDVAFDVFFGKPVFIVEHHDGFQDPTAVLEAVSRINSVAPGICWTSVGEATANSFWWRRTADAEYQVRAYSRTVRIDSACNSPSRFAVEWRRATAGPAVTAVVSDGVPGSEFDTDEKAIRTVVELGPRTSRTLSLSYATDPIPVPNPGVPHRVRAFLRRRLSEVRDNYLSRNQRLLAFAQTLQRSLSRQNT